MDAKQVGMKLVEFCRNGLNLDAISSLYSPDIVSVEPMHGNHLVMHVPHDGADGAPWSSRVLDDSLVDAHALACADFTGSGRDQIVVGWRAMNRAGAHVGAA